MWARGAAHGPAQGLTVADHIDHVRWTALLHTPVAVQPLGFQWTDARHVDPDASVKPGWVVVIGSAKAGAQAERVRVLFEPFTGRVIEIERELRP